MTWPSGQAPHLRLLVRQEAMTQSNKLRRERTFRYAFRLPRIIQKASLLSTYPSDGAPILPFEGPRNFDR
jgi:hypothetical protein